MSETRVPAIPSVTSANITDVARAIKQLLDVREGVVGDPLDANVTYRDLINAGAVTLRSGWNGSGRQPVVPTWVESDGYDPNADLSTPPKPEGVTVTGAFAAVLLQWDAPGYRNHSYAEIWRSSTNVLGNALRIGTSITRFYSDSLGSSSTAYYWVRFVSIPNVVGPYHSVDGTIGQTAPNPALLLSSLTGQITQSELYSSLSSRIDLIDGPATLAGSVAARLSAEATDRANAIAAEALARTTAIDLEAQTRALAIQQEATDRTNAIDTASDNLQTQIDLLSAASSGDISQVLSVIKAEEQSRVTNDQALASQSNLLLTLSNGNAAAIKSEASTRSTADSAQASALNLLYVNSGDAKAAVLTESQARVAGDTSTASQLVALKASSDANTAGIAIERSVNAASDSVLASQVTALSASASSANAAILNEQQVRATADIASANQSSALSATLAANSSALEVEQNTRSTADSAVATQVTTIASATANTSAGLRVEQLARSSDTSSLSSQLTQLSAISGSNSAALSVAQQASVNSDSAIASQVYGFTSVLGDALSTLRVEQQTRANADSATSAQIVRALAETDAGRAALIVEQSARSNADSSVASQVGSFASIFGANAAALVSEQSTRATADSVAASQLLKLNSAVGTNASALSSESISRTAQNSALSSQVLNLSAATNGNSAAIRSEVQARTDQYTSVSSVVTTLQSSAAGNTAAIQQEATTRATETGSLFARYGVKVDVAGHVSGFGLLSTSNGATPTSSFGVRADQFFIAPPSVASATAPTTNLYDGFVWLDTSVTPNVTRYRQGNAWVTSSPRLPFVVQSTPTTINGVSVPAGVYIDTAFIRDGTITTAKIGTAAIDNAKIAVGLDAAKITVGFLSADRIQAGTLTADKIDSRNLTIKDALGNVVFSSSGTSYLNVTGLGTLATKDTVGVQFVTGLGTLATQDTVNVQFVTGPGTLSNQISVSNAQVTGLGLFATAPQLSSANISTYVANAAIGIAQIADTIQSTNFSPTAGWRINKAGTAFFNEVALRGTINSGAFTEYAWPPVGQGGFHLGPSGLLIGNFNNGAWFQAGVDGYVSMPGLTISGGNATFSGTLTANIVNTANIVGAAVTSNYSATTSGDTVSVVVNVPPSASSLIVVAYIGDQFITYFGSGKDVSSGYALPYGTLNVNGTDVTTQGGSLVYTTGSPVIGTYSITLTRNFISGVMRIGILVAKR